jgi:membrane protein EpsK
MFSMFRGLDKVKVPGVVTLIGGIVNLCLSIVLVRFTELGIYGVALALLICLASKNLIFTPVYAAAVTGRPRMTFIKDLIPGIVMSLSVALCGMVLSGMYELATIPRLLAVSVLMFPVYGLISYFVFMKRDDRMLLWSIIFRGRSLSES